MEKKTERIAILIDGDNAQAKLLKSILEEVAKYGKVTIRRIYGDWTKTNMNSWKDLLNELSFTPIQKFSYTSGKNSTDSALIIDAMDILHSGIVDGFCIVSSDSDYTGLAKRIREGGVFVMGVGEKKTPNAFVQSCEIFTYYENIIQEEILEKELTFSKSKATKQVTATPSVAEETPKFTKVRLELIDKAYFMASPEDSGMYVAALGANLRKIDPSFDPRAHGFQNLTKLLESLKEYEVFRVDNIAFGQSLVKRKPNF
ncbi:MAG: hypothetical protein JWQ84_3612 [Mucilaginibacter sp.]|jgi:uncharacterized LabA/DUF88 family protein|nr:hypothetical protein [Mucilaginibacter sp.]MDB5138838.1 hypothetical protein [Mucilaginibacter sp.]